MDPATDLLDAIYRPAVLGVDASGRRRALSLTLSAAVFLGLGSLAYWTGPGAPPPAPTRTFATVTFDLSEGPGDPPPPPPPGPAGGRPAPGAPPEAPHEGPALLPPAVLPAPGGPGGGEPGDPPGGQAGGLPGGVVGGRVGGSPSGEGPVVLPPRFDAAYLRNPEPDYPALSRRFREEGRVVLRVLVSEEGISRHLEIRDSSGHPRLDQAALEAVRRWRFTPARRGTEPTAAWVLVPLTFSLDA